MKYIVEPKRLLNHKNLIKNTQNSQIFITKKSSGLLINTLQNVID